MKLETEARLNKKETQGMEDDVVLFGVLLIGGVYMCGVWRVH